MTSRISLTKSAPILNPRVVISIKSNINPRFFISLINKCHSFIAMTFKLPLFKFRFFLSFERLVKVSVNIQTKIRRFNLRFNQFINQSTSISLPSFKTWGKINLFLSSFLSINLGAFFNKIGINIQNAIGSLIKTPLFSFRVKYLFFKNFVLAPKLQKFFVKIGYNQGGNFNVYKINESLILEGIVIGERLEEYHIYMNFYVKMYDSSKPYKRYILQKHTPEFPEELIICNNHSSDILVSSINSVYSEEGNQSLIFDVYFKPEEDSNIFSKEESSIYYDVYFNNINTNKINVYSGSFKVQP